MKLDGVGNFQPLFGLVSYNPGYVTWLSLIMTVVDGCGGRLWWEVVEGGCGDVLSTELYLVCLLQMFSLDITTMRVALETYQSEGKYLCHLDQTLKSEGFYKKHTVCPSWGQGTNTWSVLVGAGQKITRSVLVWGRGQTHGLS